MRHAGRCWRHVFGAALAGLLMTLSMAAQSAPPSRQQALQQLASKSAQARRAALDRLAEVGLMQDAKALVAALADDQEAVRTAAEAALWMVWGRSGNAAVDKLYRTGVAQMNSADVDAALNTFSEIIRLKPDFAEGWNKRATVLYFSGRLQESLADCDEVLKRNPYHFGALSGYGQIHSKLENFDQALEYFERALAINPNMQGVALNVLALRKLLAERQRKAT